MRHPIQRMRHIALIACACLAASLRFSGPPESARAGAAAVLTPRAYLPSISLSVPLGDLFPQAGTAQEFSFINPPGSLAAQIAAGGCAHDGQAGLKVSYSFSQRGNGGWGVRWDTRPASQFDTSPFDSFSFWVKGSAPNGFQIGIKDSSEHEAKVEARDYIQVIETGWRKLSLPLSRFSGVDLANVRNVNIGFNASHATGDICIDGMTFETLGDVFPQRAGGDQFTFVNPPGAFDVRFSQAPDCVHSGSYGLRIDYGFAGTGNGGWGVHWSGTPAGHLDATGFAKLVFWVRGQAPNGFQIGLKDTSEHEVKLDARDYVTVVAGEWRLAQVPLSAFSDAGGQVSLAAIRNVNVGFNSTHGAGGICIDEIGFQ